MSEERKEKLFNKMYYDYLEREEAEEVIDYLLKLEEKNKQLKDKINNATEWVHKHISKYNCKGITIKDWDELSNPNNLLEILGEKENDKRTIDNLVL